VPGQRLTEAAHKAENFGAIRALNIVSQCREHWAEPINGIIICPEGEMHANVKAARAAGSIKVHARAGNPPAVTAQAQFANDLHRCLGAVSGQDAVLRWVERSTEVNGLAVSPERDFANQLILPTI
jgi:hypothetical protein